jgi:arylsulfatase A-like enzyme
MFLIIQSTQIMARLLTGLLLLFTFASLAICQQPPNIVVILADDLGVSDKDWTWDSLFAPFPASNTPYLQQMAREGWVGNRTYSQAVCCPSRATLNSGLRPTHPKNGVFQNTGDSKENAQWIQPESKEFVHDSVINFAQTLKAAGYRTASVGKYRTSKRIDPAHADFPLNRGYDVFAEGGGINEIKWRYTPLSHNKDPYLGDYVLPYTGKEVKHLAKFQSHYSQQEMLDLLKGKDKHLTDALEQIVEDTITQFTTEHPNDPFLMFWAPHAPHGPFDPRQDLAAKYPNSPRTGLVEGLDQAIGRLLQYLRNRCLDDKTLVLFFSDNGAPQGFHTDALTGFKGQFWEGGVRAVNIAWQPGTVPAGSVSNKLIHFVDLHATLADVAGVPAPATDGISFKPLIYDQPGPKRKRFFYHVPRLNQARSVGYDGRYALDFWYTDRRWRLYNIKQNNLQELGTEIDFSQLNSSNQQRVLKLCNLTVAYLADTRSVDRNWLIDKATGDKLPLPDCVDFE